MDKEVIKPKEEKNLETYPNVGSWHGLTRHEYVHTKGDNNRPDYKSPFIICGLITGCGAAQIRGLSYLTKDNFERFKEVFDDVIQRKKVDGVGILIGTLGQSFYKGDRSCEPYVLQLGFTLVSEYNNWRHGSEYMQRMYQYIIN